MSTSPTAKTVLVAGATGRLGAVVDLLLARGHTVRALARDPASAAAARLRENGADIVAGDFDEVGTIEAAAAGVDAVFATGTAHRVGPDGEERHGHNLATAVASAGVPHLVYCSGDGASPDSPLPLFRAKFRVEEHLRSLPVPHTILAPVYFMENLFNPWNLPVLEAGTVPSPIAVEVPLQQLAIADLLAFAAIVIERPGEFAGQRIALASDELSGDEAAAAISKAIDRHLDARAVPRQDLPPGVRPLFAWLEEEGHDVDIDGLRRRYPEVGWHRYADWARASRARFRELCRHSAPVAH